MKRYLQLTQHITELEKSELGRATEQLEECLASLSNSLDALHQQYCSSTAGYKQVIAGEDIVRIAACSSALTTYLEDDSLLSFQEQFANLWVKSVLLLGEHYYHFLGPAIVANIKIALRKGDNNKAKDMALAMLRDFEPLLQYLENTETQPQENDNDHEALLSVSFAVDLLINDPDQCESAERVKQRLEAILRKPLGKLK